MSDPAIATPASDTPPAPTFAKQRLHSLDAYRGLIMISLAFGGFGLAKTAQKALEANPDSSFWQSVYHQFEHGQWVGCAYWDLIQPSFMFMVGMSMAYSYVRRQRDGQAYSKMLLHAMGRSVILIGLGIFLISNWSKSTEWSWMNVLTQIGMGYTFLFLLWGRSLRAQAIAAGALLAGTWLAYMVYPNAGIDLMTGAPERGVSAEWAAQHLHDVGAAWHKNANIGHAIDVWFLNLFPLEKPFAFNRGGYQSINFIPELATMIFGLMCGELIRSERSPAQKVKILIIAGVGGLIVGQLMHATGFCPIVKRIWTPSWTLFSTGWCCLILAGLYHLVDVKGYQKWTFPLMVVGMNSIAIYCMEMLLRGWTSRTLRTHLGQDLFEMCGTIWAPTVEATLVGLCFWGACYYMYRQKIFIRI